MPRKRKATEGWGLYHRSRRKWLPGVYDTKKEADRAFTRMTGRKRNALTDWFRICVIVLPRDADVKPYLKDWKARGLS